MSIDFSVSPAYRTWAEIDLDALTKNFALLRSKTAEKVLAMAVVKADAYGHGARYTAPALDAAGADWFGVACLSEALNLRRAGIEKPILILGYTPPVCAKTLAEYRITQTLLSYEYAQKLSSAALTCDLSVDCHLKLDTGMGRIGFDVTDPAFPKNAADACKLPNLSVSGVFTHFASADGDGDEDGSFTQAQFDRFCAGADAVEALGVPLPLRHCCNSAGVLLGQRYNLNMVRDGIAVYGLSSSPAMNDDVPLKPVMSLRTVVSMVKTLKKGQSVSYGRTFTADHDMTVASVCLGYADGYLRRLAGKADMLLHGKRVPIIGRICMDQLMLDVSELDTVQEGDIATAFGRDGDACIRLDELAQLSNTINDELICLVARRVPRVYMQNGKIAAVTDYVGEE